MANLSYDPFPYEYILPPGSLYSESWTNGHSGSVNREILYAKVPEAFSNLVMYEPIQKITVAPNNNLPVLVVLKGTDSLWEVVKDLNMFLDYTTNDWFPAQLTAYETEKNNIRAFIKTYMDANATQPLLFIGHSLGCKFIQDITVELVRDFNMGHRIQGLHLFNPYMFPGSTNYQYMHEQASDNTKPHHNIYYTNTHMYIIKKDFASVFIRGPVGFGKVIYFDSPEALPAGNTDAVVTLSEWMNALSYGSTRQQYLDIVNHKMACWTDTKPTRAYESWSPIGDEKISIATGDEQDLSNYFPEVSGAPDTQLRRLWLWQDPHLAELPNWKVNIEHEDAQDRASNHALFVPIARRKPGAQTDYFRYQIDVGGGTQNYIANLLELKFYDYEPPAATPNTYTTPPIKTKECYILYTGATGGGLANYVLAVPAVSPNEAKEVITLRITTGQWNNGAHFGTLNPSGSTLLASSSWYEFTQIDKTTSSGANMILRSTWRLHHASAGVNPLNEMQQHGQRRDYVAPAPSIPTPTVGTEVEHGKTYRIWSVNTEYRTSAGSTSGNDIFLRRIACEIGTTWGYNSGTTLGDSKLAMCVDKSTTGLQDEWACERIDGTGEIKLTCNGTQLKVALMPVNDLGDTYPDVTINGNMYLTADASGILTDNLANPVGGFKSYSIRGVATTGSTVMAESRSFYWSSPSRDPVVPAVITVPPASPYSGTTGAQYWLFEEVVSSGIP